MSRGRRYETEGKLNYQKVFAVIIAIIVIAMVIMIIKNVFKQREKLNKEYEYFTAFSADKWGVINQDGEEVIKPSFLDDGFFLYVKFEWIFQLCALTFKIGV